MIKAVNDINRTTKDNAEDIKSKSNNITHRLDEINNNIVLIHDQYKSVKNEIVKIKTINDKNVNTYKVVKTNVAKANRINLIILIKPKLIMISKLKLNRVHHFSLRGRSNRL